MRKVATISARKSPKVLGLSGAAVLLALVALLRASPALATLTATPVTWNVVGLDSNSPATGPNHFPVGARVCSNVATTSVGVSWIWDSANPNLNLRPGSLGSITIPSIAAGACADAYFEVEVTQVPAAYDTTRRYHITATDFSGTVSTPTPRELYVEHLISQNRNSTTGVKLNGVSIPAGGAMNLVVGNTYTIELDGATATQGYEQLEEFINFSNTIFQILSVNTTYSADTSPLVPNPNDKLYADACGWENDPNSPSYRSCVGAGGKAGGTVITVYTVKIISGGGTSHTLSSLIYDFSGSSYHYNSDFTTGARIATIIDPTLVSISKKFAPNPSTVGGVSTLTFTISNTNGGAVGPLSFTDIFPTSPGAMVVANPPGATTAGCGTPTFAPAAGAASISFSNGTVAANSSCTVSVKVTAPAVGTYTNTSGNLFAAGVDTLNSATDTLTVGSTPGPPPPVCGITMANWSVPNGTVANPPDLAGGVPTAKAANVLTAAATANVPANTSITASSGHVDTTSWSTFGYKTVGQFIQFSVDTSQYTAVQMSFWVANPSPANGPSQITLTVNSGAGFGAPVLTINSPVAAFTNHTANLTGLTSTTGPTIFRLTATGANNDASGASLNYDDIVFTGCGTPLPPTISKAFAPNPVAVGGTSTLTFTVTNPNASVALSGVAFADSLPSGLTAPNGTTTPCGGSLVVTGTNLLTFSGGTIGAGGSCTIPVTVTATTAGPHANVSGFVSSTEGGTNNGATGIASASLTAVLPPSISKQFAPNPIQALGTSTLTFLVTNPNQNDTLASVAFSDTFPVSPGAMVVAAAPGASTSGCGAPVFSPAAGAGSVSFTGGTIAGGGTCTVTVNVTAPVVGTYANTSGNVSFIINAATVPGNTASASLTVTPSHPAIGALKQVGLTSNPLGTWGSFLAVTAGTNVFYKITIENDGDVPLSPVGATDPNVDLTSCVWPASLPVAVAANNNHIATCVVGPVVAASGFHSNTATASGTGGGTTVTDTSTASYATTGISIVKSVAETSFSAAGDLLHYSYLVTNSGSAPLQGPVTVSDTKATVSCPAVSTVGDLDAFLDPGESLTCTATYTVTAGDVSATFVTNNAFATVSGVNSSTVSKTVPLAGTLSITKSFGAANIALGGTVNMSFLLSNPSGTSLTGVAFSDAMPAGLTAPNGTTSPCGGSLVITGGNALAFSGGSLAPATTCTINVTVTGATAGVKNNTTGPISSNETGAAGTSNTATVTVVAPPTIGKTFGAASIALSGTTNLDIALSNPNATVALSGVAFTDALPSGLTAPNGTTSPCGGTLTITGGNLLTFSGGSLAAGGNCTITVTVTGSSAGIQNNTTSPVTASGPVPLTGTTSNTATVTVTAPTVPTIAKSFAAPNVALGGTVSMSFLLTNTSTTPLTGVAFTDSLPAGLTAPNGTTTPCGGSLVIAGGTGLTFSGGTLAASGNCTITVTVTGATAGVKNNTTGPISSNESGPGAPSNTATVTVLAPPTIGKAFGAGSIPLAGTTNLDLTLTNPNATVAISGLAFTDPLPSGLTAPNGTTTPCGGSLTITGGNLLTFSGGTLVASGSCTITVTVTGATTGIQTNTTSAVTATGPIPLTGTSATATVTVTAPGAPTITKSFAAPDVALGDPVDMSFVLNNPGATPLTGVAFSDTLPAGLTAPNGTTTPCGGSLTISGGSGLAFSGGALAAGGSCTITVTVTGAVAGVQNNTTGPISSNESGAGGASNIATVTVLAPPTIAKSFGVGSIPLAGTTSLDLTLANPNTTVALSGVGFTDALPSALTAPNGVTSPCGGTLTITGGNLLTFTGGTLAAGGSCPISVTVTGVAIGTQNNTTSPITAAGPVSLTGAPSNTATVTVTAPGAPTISKSFAGTNVALGGTVDMSFLLTNTSATPLTGVAFSDSLPAGLTAPNGTTAQCGGSLVITGGNVLTFSAGGLAPSASCTVTVTVTGSAAGVQNNTTGPISSNESGAGGPSNTATVTVLAPPTIAKAFGAGSIPLSGTTNLDLTLTNPNATVALTGVDFTDALPSGLTAANGTTTPCGGTLTITGGNLLTFAGGTLAGGAGCPISITVTGVAIGTQNNTTSAITAAGPVSLTGAPSNTATVTVTAPGAPTISKSFAGSNVALGGTVAMSFTLNNPSATPMTGVAFTDGLPAGLTAPNGAAPICGGTLTITGGNLLSFSGGTLAATTGCTITVTVTGTAAGVQNNTTGPISSNESGPGGPSNTASVTVVAPPSIAKAFGAASIPLGGTTSLSLTLTNPNAAVALTGVAFTDALPAGLTAPNGVTSPCGGTLTITGGNFLTFTGGALPAGGGCTITVTVTGAATGIQNNTTSAVTAGGPVSLTGTPSNTATITVTVPGAPTIAKSFSTATVAIGGTVGMSFVLTNPGAAPLTGVAFSDVLPSGLTAPNGTTAACGGSLTITGGTLLTFSAGALAAGANCTITVTVTGTAAGVQNNTTGPISSTETGVGGPSNTATVTVVAPPSIAKAFGVSSMPIGGTTSLDITLTNPNATVALSGLAFTDLLPAGLTSPNGTTATCGGTLTITGANLLTFSGGTLGAGASCTITVTVTGSSAGTMNNTTSPLTATGPVLLTGTPSNTATVTIGAPVAAAGIPTLAPWMLLSLTLLLAWAGSRFARR